MSEPGWMIADRYRVLGRIGAGGMADVLRAHDEMLDRDVAVKVFRSTPVGPDGSADTASGVERQRAELAALARLNHPNLTTLYDGAIVGQQGPAYLVMELIDGPSLAQAIEDGGLTEAQARVVGAQIADALAYVHSAGMVHRDVKPANILLGSDRNSPDEGVRARLTDFGIVRLVGTESLTQADMTLGSASYLAPEQARGSAVGPPADVYALGLTLIEALTGRRSFDGPALEAVVARLTNDPEIPDTVPEPWPSLLTAMTARDPARRPTASRVASTLRGAESLTAPISSVPAATYDTAVLPSAVAAAASAPVTGSSTVSRPATHAAGPQPRRWSASLIIAGILVLALAIAGIALLLVSGGGGAGSPGRSGSTTPTAPTTSSSTSRDTRTHPRSSAPATSTSPTASDTSTTAPATHTTSPSAPTSSAPTTSAPSTTRTSTSASSAPSTSRTATSSAAAGGVAVTPTPTRTPTRTSTRTPTVTPTRSTVTSPA